jgi:hypothetical protein
MPPRSPRGAALVEEHGVLLQSAKGPVPNLADLVAGERIRGSWWSHPRSHDIFDAVNEARDSDDVVALRLVRGKVTLVHRRLWPALVRIADRYAASALAALHEEHLPNGRHKTTRTPFPEWVPEDVERAAKCLSVDDAEALLPEGFVSPVVS